MDRSGRNRLRLARPHARQGQPQGRSWYRIANKANEVAKVYLYGEVGGDWFGGGVTAEDFVDELGDITAPRIDLHLNTVGGDIFDGFAIYRALVEHPAEVTAIVDAAALSIGSVIAMAGDTIAVAKVGQMMIHDGWGLAIGNAADMRETADLLDKLSDTIAGVYADRTGAPVAFWRDAMLAETWYNAEEAVAAGLADEIRQVKGNAEQGPEDAFDLSRFRYAGRAKAPAPSLRPAAAATGPRPPAEADPDPEPEPTVVVVATDEELLEALDEQQWAAIGQSLRASLDETFTGTAGYDPRTVAGLIADIYADAPAPPDLPPAPERPRTAIPIDEFVDAIVQGVKEGVRQ